MGRRLPRTEEIVGSTPTSSTTFPSRRPKVTSHVSPWVNTLVRESFCYCARMEQRWLASLISSKSTGSIPACATPGSDTPHSRAGQRRLRLGYLVPTTSMSRSLRVIFTQDVACSSQAIRCRKALGVTQLVECPLFPARGVPLWRHLVHRSPSTRVGATRAVRQP